MSFTSIQFLLFVAAVVLLYQASRVAPYRRVVRTLANLVFIASFATDLRAALPLLGFLAWSYLWVELARRQRSTTMLALGIVAVLTPFILLKRFSFLDCLPSLPFPYLVVGLSYILFRVLHLMIDAHGGELERRVPVEPFFNYTCDFLCFVSGPIQRFQDYLADRQAPDPGLDDQTVFAAFSRIIAGFIKIAVISAIANYAFLNLSERLLLPRPDVAGLRLAALYGLSVIAFVYYLYYNFSGYMDVVIGIGRLLGQRLPENFDRPFTARNFLEFWQRWHMTLSNWFKLYLFNPLVGALAGRFTSRAAAPYLGVIAFFVTFGVMGVWHGTTTVFVIYGLLMGAGASANKLWQVALTRRLGKQGYRRLAENPLYLYGCRGVTYAYFAVAVTCLWVDMRQLADLLHALGVAGLVASFLMIAAGGAAAMAAWDTLAAGARRLIGRRAEIGRHLVLANVLLAARVLMILGVMSFFHRAPEFVYKAF